MCSGRIKESKKISYEGRRYFLRTKQKNKVNEKKKKERNSKKTFNVTRAAYKIYRTVENSEDSVLLFP